MSGAVIRLRDGVRAAHEVADCGHPFKVPMWAHGEWSRAKCDHCSTVSERNRWDAWLNRQLSATARLPMGDACDTTLIQSQAAVRLCAICPEPATKRTGYCSSRCRRLAQFPTRRCALPGCDQVFRSGNQQRRCCTPKHNRRLYRQEHPEQYPPSTFEDRQRRWQHRRAVKAGARTGRPVRLLEIAERDGWTCKLCHLPVDPSLRWPDPMSRSLDHVLALSRGGAHDPDNVQLAHLVCNVAKGST